MTESLHFYMATSSPFWPLLLLLIPLTLLIYSVSNLHKSWNYEEKPKKLSPKSKKADHLILGPASGQGLPNRLQCQGLKAMNKDSSINNMKMNQGDAISFVTVFTIYKSTPPNEESLDRVKVGEMSYNNKGERSMAILNAYINFIQVSMPKSNVIILTDPASKFSLNRENAIISPIEGDYSRNNLMLQRIKSYIAFLEKKLEEEEIDKGVSNSNHFVFTDSDIAVVDNIGEFFHKYPNFDVALTFRNNKNQPINSGFIAVRGSFKGIKKAKLFLELVLDAYMSKYTGASRMLGDQLALYWVIKTHLSSEIKKFYQHEIFRAELKGVSLLFLPCEIYNWTPPEGASQFHGMPLDVKIVHFKGSRKRLMLESWNYYSATHNMSNMLCLILSSGRTKYDF